jgi:hypothetical protein
VNWRNDLQTNDALKWIVYFDSGERKSIMRTILLSFIAAIVLLGGFTSCSTTVKTDNGHGVTAGVH